MQSEIEKLGLSYAVPGIRPDLSAHFPPKHLKIHCIRVTLNNRRIVPSGQFTAALHARNSASAQKSCCCCPPDRTTPHIQILERRRRMRGKFARLVLEH